MKKSTVYTTNKLHQYYSGPSYELTNVSGQVKVIIYSNVSLFNQQNQKFQAFLLEKMKINTKKKHMG